MKDEITPIKPTFIYVLTSPLYPNDVRYVGVTDNPKRRLAKHILDGKGIKTNHRANWIRSLLNDGLEPIMTIIDKTNEDNWQQCEIGWIAHYKALGCDLVNSTDGGRGARGMARSEETRRKISESGRGRIPSEETRRKISEARHNRPPVSDETRRKISESASNPSEETRRKMSEARRGKKGSEALRRKMSESSPHKKPIYQYDKFGRFIRQWDSISQAGHQLGINTSSIVQCCKHKLRLVGFYIWRYADDPLLGEHPIQLSLGFDE